MTMWPLYEQDEGNSGCSRSPSIIQHEEPPTSPRLEVADLDAVPFSQKFSDLFDSLGLHIPLSVEKKNRISRSPDISYDIENITDIKGVNPEWQHDEAEEIAVMSLKRAFDLSTILEDPSFVQAPSACLSDFDVEDSDTSSTAGSSIKANYCTKRDTGQKFVIKRKQTRNDSSWSEKVVLEMLSSLPLSFISTLRWTFRNEEHVYIVLDHYPSGTLLDLVNQHGPLGSHRAIFYASELVSAISSLHEAGIMHKDLEPRHIALDAEGHVVITNFARAESLPVGPPHGGSSTIGYGDSLSEFQAPEIFLGWSLDSSVDCWSFGMLMYFMIFGTHPYGGKEAVNDPRWLYDRVVVFSVPKESLRLVHPMARDLITKCLQRNPSLRWTMEKIKSHGYFALVNWNQVSAKQVEAPSFRRTAMEVDRTVFQNESHRRHVSLNTSLQEPDGKPNLIEGTSHRRTQSAITRNIRSRTTPDPPISSDIFRPLSIATISEVNREENEPISMSASIGHLGTEGTERPLPVALEPTERISKFWAELDNEEQGSVASVLSQEFGTSHGIGYTKAPKLRKYRSVIHSHRLFSLSTSSFQKKLRKKPRSTATLRQERQAEPIDNLPIGLHQIGSGIGFTYNIPAGAPSKASVCSFAPSCHHLFNGGFPALNLGLGLGQPPRMRAKVTPDRSPRPPSNDAPARGPGPQRSPRAREVGNRTFIRDMYRSPSWILSPPDSLPSPMALVNQDSPLVPGSDTSGPFTPATLVDGDCDHDHDHNEDHPREVTIRIPKNLELDMDFRMWAPDSTLRLVPPAVHIVSEESMFSACDHTGEDPSFKEATSTARA